MTHGGAPTLGRGGLQPSVPEDEDDAETFLLRRGMHLEPRLHAVKTRSRKSRNVPSSAPEPRRSHPRSRWTLESLHPTKTFCRLLYRRFRCYCRLSCSVDRVTSKRERWEWRQRTRRRARRRGFGNAAESAGGVSRGSDSDPAPVARVLRSNPRAGQDAAEFVLRFGAVTHHLDLSHVAAGLSGDAGRADGTCEGKAAAHGDRTDDTRLPMGCGTACGALARPAAGGDDSQRRPKRSGQSFHFAESRCAAAASAYMQDGASCRKRFDDRNGNMENMEKARKRRKRLEACTWPFSCSLEFVLFRASPSGYSLLFFRFNLSSFLKTDSIWRPWRVPVPRFGLGSLPNPQVVKPSSVGQTAARTLGLVLAGH